MITQSNPRTMYPEQSTGNAMALGEALVSTGLKKHSMLEVMTAAVNDPGVKTDNDLIAYVRAFARR